MKVVMRGTHVGTRRVGLSQEEYRSHSLTPSFLAPPASKAANENNKNVDRLRVRRPGWAGPHMCRVATRTPAWWTFFFTYRIPTLT